MYPTDSQELKVSVKLTPWNQFPPQHVAPSDTNEFTKKVFKVVFQKHAKTQLCFMTLSNCLGGHRFSYNLYTEETDELYS